MCAAALRMSVYCHPYAKDGGDGDNDMGDISDMSDIAKADVGKIHILQQIQF